MVLEMGGADTLPEFTENLRGVTPGEERDFDVAYPEDYGSERLAGKTVRFHAIVKGHAPERTAGTERRVCARSGRFPRSGGAARLRCAGASRRSGNMTLRRQPRTALWKAWWIRTISRCPQTFIERQVRNRVEQSLRAMAGDGVDPGNLQIDWAKVMESQKEKADREVKASLLLSKVAEREAIHATREEVDKEVERIARQQREPVAAVQMRFEKDGTLGRIASHIQTRQNAEFSCLNTPGKRLKRQNGIHVMQVHCTTHSFFQASHRGNCQDRRFR